MPVADPPRDRPSGAAPGRGAACRDGRRPRRSVLSASARAEPSPSTSRARFAAIGLLGGFLGSLLGVGGGFVMVPLQVVWAKLGPHVANGTSLAVIGPIALAGVPVYALAGGEVEFRLVVPLAVGAVLGAYLGARAVARVPEAILRRIVAVVLLLAGLKQLILPG